MTNSEALVGENGCANFASGNIESGQIITCMDTQRPISCPSSDFMDENE